eukprot:jgi/Tetstr1/464168/TSEL_008973.t1
MSVGTDPFMPVAITMALHGLASKNFQVFNTDDDGGGDNKAIENPNMKPKLPKPVFDARSPDVGPTAKEAMKDALRSTPLQRNGLGLMREFGPPPVPPLPPPPPPPPQTPSPQPTPPPQTPSPQTPTPTPSPQPTPTPTPPPSPQPTPQPTPPPSPQPTPPPSPQPTPQQTPLPLPPPQQTPLPLPPPQQSPSSEPDVVFFADDDDDAIMEKLERIADPDERDVLNTTLQKFLNQLIHRIRKEGLNDAGKAKLILRDWVQSALNTAAHAAEADIPFPTATPWHEEFASGEEAEHYDNLFDLYKDLLLMRVGYFEGLDWLLERALTVYPEANGRHRDVKEYVEFHVPKRLFGDENEIVAAVSENRERIKHMYDALISADLPNIQTRFPLEVVYKMLENNPMLVGKIAVFASKLEEGDDLLVRPDSAQSAHAESESPPQGPPAGPTAGPPAGPPGESAGPSPPNQLALSAPNQLALSPPNQLALSAPGSPQAAAETNTDHAAQSGSHYNYVSAVVTKDPKKKGEHKSLFDSEDLEELLQTATGGGGCGPFEGWVVLLGAAVVRFLVLAGQRFGDSVRKADRRAVFRALLIDLGLGVFAVMVASASRLIRPDHLQRAVIAAMVGWFVSCGCVIGLMGARCALRLDDAAVSALAYAGTFGVSVSAAAFS